MNNEVLEYETEDLKKSLLRFKPEDVHTEVFVVINKDDTDFTRKFAMEKAKHLFRDEEQLNIFLNTYHSLYA